MNENASFIEFDHSVHGLVFDDSEHPKYPIRYYNVTEEDGRHHPESSYYYYVYRGGAELHYANEYGDDYARTLQLRRGDYGSFHGSFELSPRVLGKFGMILIEVLTQEGDYPLTNYRAQALHGQGIEPEGRLKYIDGCTDSLLIPPVKLGDPCLNHLHFPKGITQTPHTHPSHRIGIVARGSGECVTPFGNLPLYEGMIFVIKEWDGESHDVALDGTNQPNGTHKFNTYDEAMDVIAFHPDSDFGPTDITHPMINRTIVDGKSASAFEHIRTK